MDGLINGLMQSHLFYPKWMDVYMKIVLVFKFDGDRRIDDRSRLVQWEKFSIIVFL